MKSHTKSSYLLHWICDNQRLVYAKIKSVNPLYLIIGEINGYFEEINRNKCLTLVPTKKARKY